MVPMRTMVAILLANATYWPAATGRAVMNPSKGARMVVSARPFSACASCDVTPEQRAARGKIGMTVLARVAAYPDRDFTGTVTAVNPSVDPNSRVFILQAKFDNPK